MKKMLVTLAAVLTLAASIANAAPVEKHQGIFANGSQASVVAKDFGSL